MGDSTDGPSGKASRFGIERAVSVTRPKLSKAGRVLGPGAPPAPLEPIQLVPQPPNPALANAFAPRAWRNRPRVRQQRDEHGSGGEDWYDDQLPEDEGIRSSVRIQPKHSKSTQDELWQKARQPLLTQYYASVQQQQEHMLQSVADRVARLRVAPTTCSKCIVAQQPVLFVGLHAAVEVLVTFAHCPRCGSFSFKRARC